jgi:hypothetical protein
MLPPIHIRKISTTPIVKGKLLLSAVRSGRETMADGISVWVNNIEHVTSELAHMEIDGINPSS